MHKVGVTWGKTIACVVDALETRLPLPPRKSSAIEFVPLSGTLLSDPNIRLSSSSLVDRLHEIVNGQSTGALSLAAVPARLPGKMLPLTHKLRSLKKQFGLNNKSLWELQRAILEVYIHEIHGYQNVFLGGVGKEPLAERVDTILTSVGCDYAQSNDPWLNEMISCETLAKDNDGARRELARIAVGDLGGIFLPTPDARQEDLEKLADINRRWKGASESHIQECAVRAANEGKPGVILIAIGARKAKIVKECVRKGLINQLVIDRDLAEEIATANL